MKPSPSDRVEIIRLVEESHLPARRTLEILGIARSSFYRWYDRYQRGGGRTWGSGAKTLLRSAMRTLRRAATGYLTATLRRRA